MSQPFILIRELQDKKDATKSSFLAFSSEDCYNVMALMAASSDYIGIQLSHPSNRQTPFGILKDSVLVQDCTIPISERLNDLQFSCVRNSVGRFSKAESVYPIVSQQSITDGHQLAKHILIPPYLLRNSDSLFV